MDKKRITDVDSEKTGSLINQEAGRKKLNKAAVIGIAAALIVACVIGVFAYRAHQEKVYAQAVELADKAFEEGSYETAVVQYSKAVKIKKEEAPLTNLLTAQEETGDIVGAAETCEMLIEVVKDETKKAEIETKLSDYSETANTAKYADVYLGLMEEHETELTKEYEEINGGSPGEGFTQDYRLSLCDITGDGVPEMFLSYADDESEATYLHIYTVGDDGYKEIDYTFDYNMIPEDRVPPSDKLCRLTCSLIWTCAMQQRYSL